MENKWNGMAVGTFAGVAVGVMIDVVAGTGRPQAKDGSARAAEALTLVKRGAGRIAELAEFRFDDWDVRAEVGQVREAVVHVVDKGRDALERR